MIIKCTENLALPKSHRVKLELAGIPGCNVTFFLPLEHEWAKIKPEETYQLKLEKIPNDPKQ
jgi:hypothetical protein